MIAIEPAMYSKTDSQNLSYFHSNTEGPKTVQKGCKTKGIKGDSQLLFKTLLFPSEIYEGQFIFCGATDSGVRVRVLILHCFYYYSVLGKLCGGLFIYVSELSILITCVLDFFFFLDLRKNE